MPWRTDFEQAAEVVERALRPARLLEPLDAVPQRGRAGPPRPAISPPSPTPGADLRDGGRPAGRRVARGAASRALAVDLYPAGIQAPSGRNAAETTIWSSSSRTAGGRIGQLADRIGR